MNDDSKTPEPGPSLEKSNSDIAPEATPVQDLSEEDYRDRIWRLYIERGDKHLPSA